MVHLVGESWQKPAMLAALESAELPDGVIPIDDRFLEAEGSPWRDLSPDLRRLATDRAALRRFGGPAGLAVPRWGVGNTFEEISKQVIAWGRFPLAIKSAVNGSFGSGVFRLEGYRELPGFFEKIKALEPAAPVLIEDWIEGSAVVEVTLDPRGSTLISQKGMEKSLTARTAWELFPVKLPDHYGREVERILSAFAPLLAQKSVLTRFTIAFAGSSPFLIALSGACNRLAYFPGWGNALGRPPVLKSLLEKAPTLARPDKTGFGRLQVLRRPARLEPFPVELPAAAKKLPVSRYFAAGRKALALLEEANPRALQEKAVLLTRLLEEAAGH